MRKPYAPTLSLSHALTFLLFHALTLLCCGCQEELRVPYVPPTLANWPQPYRGVAGLKVDVLNTGYVRVTEALFLRGGSLTRTRELPVPVFLIEHPKQGLILFNTGLPAKSKHESAPRSGLLGMLFAPEIVAGRGVRHELQQADFKADAVRWIVLSNLRFDHAGGVREFPNARVVVAKAEHEYARAAPSGYDPAALDDVANWKFIDFDESARPLATFPLAVDLFGDSSCMLIDARGSTPGTMALLIRLAHQPLLLADDLAAVEESVRYPAKPAAPYDIADWWDRIWRLKRFKDLVPDLVVVPGHDVEPLRRAGAADIVVHAFAAPETAARPTPTRGMFERLIPKPM